jgi:hypothetical protein
MKLSPTTPDERGATSTGDSFAVFVATQILHPVTCAPIRGLYTAILSREACEWLHIPVMFRKEFVSLPNGCWFSTYRWPWVRVSVGRHPSIGPIAGAFTQHGVLRRVAGFKMISRTKSMIPTEGFVSRADESGRGVIEDGGIRYIEFDLTGLSILYDESQEAVQKEIQRFKEYS